MNKSMLMGLVGGIGLATAGGVAGYALMSRPADIETESAVVEQVGEAAAIEATQADARPAAQAQPAPAPAPAPARTAAAAPAPAPAQECWEEEVEVPAEPRDQRAIAGTATGAILGGAIAKKLCDDNDLLTAAGAAAGAFAGRRLQREVQENNTTTVIETRCAPAQ